MISLNYFQELDTGIQTSFALLQTDTKYAVKKLKWVIMAGVMTK